MDSRQFTEAIQVISKFFGMSWPTDAISAAYETVSNEPVEAMTAAHKRVCLEFSPRPQPPIGKITAIILDEGKKHRMKQGTAIEDQWNQQKRGGAQSASRFFDKEKSTEHAKRAIFLIIERMEGRMTNQMYLAVLERMAQDYPGLGDGSPHGVGWEDLYQEEKLRPARAALRMAA